MTALVELELLSIWFNDDDVEGVWIVVDDEVESVDVEDRSVVGAGVVVEEEEVVVVETDFPVDGEEGGVIEEGGDDETGNGVE